MSERITWTDVQRAANRLADVWQQIGGERPADGLDSLRAQVIANGGEPTSTGCASLYVSPGSVTNGHVAVMTWTGPNAAGVPVPGGQHLARSARDSYDMVTQRTAALLDVAAYITGKVQ